MLNPQQQAEQAAFDKAVKEAMGIDPVAYTEKLNWLRDKWEKKVEEDRGNSVTTRIMAPIVLRGRGGPVYVSIIADNLDYFKKELESIKQNPHKASYLDLIKAFHIACLCGSQQIGEFLLKELNIDYTQEKYDYILGYVCASQNEEWMKIIARAMAQANRERPLSIFGNASFSIVDMIDEIFEEAQKGSPENKSKRQLEEDLPLFLKVLSKKSKN